MSNTGVTFRKMEREEIHDLLARNHVGRIAYAKGTAIDIEPIHYVYSEGWLYGRTSTGTKPKRTGTEWWPVAFEVDEIEGLFDWQSAVVHGGFYTLSPDGPEWEKAAHGQAIALLRELVPQTFTPDDPTPFRDVVFRIAVQEAFGRAATSTATSNRDPITLTPSGAGA